VIRRGGLGLALFLALMAGACSKAVEDEPVAAPAPAVGDVISNSMAGRGEAIAELACAQCHAIGATGDSPHPDAPPFRRLSRTVDLGTLPERFAEGHITSHPDMPDWQFEEVDMEGLIAYLEKVQAPDAE
jgi:mono/diheme cytochrome c family protein